MWLVSNTLFDRVVPAEVHGVYESTVTFIFTGTMVKQVLERDNDILPGEILLYLNSQNPIPTSSDF